MRTNSVGADYEAFQYTMGIALEQAPVHIGTGITFIGINNDILCFAWCVTGGLPFHTCGETTTTPSPQIRPFYHFHYIIRAHFEEGLCQGSITAQGNIIVDVLGVN